MRPQPCSAISGAAARISRSGARTLSCHWRSQSSSVSNSSGRIHDVPALLTSTSIPPRRSTQAATIRSPASGFVTLAARISASFGAASASPSRSRATSSSRAPSAASRSAVARPMPRLAPVTRQRFPFRPRSMAALLRVAELEHGEEGLLRDLDAADLLHPLLALLLLLQQLALARDVAPVALGDDVLAEGLHRLARDDARAYGRLD